jgi:hypothetical protein
VQATNVGQKECKFEMQTKFNVETNKSGIAFKLIECSYQGENSLHQQRENNLICQKMEPS